jgi:hypothetical protein
MKVALALAAFALVLVMIALLATVELAVLSMKKLFLRH